MRITTIDAHAAGEPLRIITAGFPPIPGKTILAKRRFAQENLDHLRRALMWEPRGHADMYGCIITEPERPDSHLGVLFMHNEGFSTMCGHGIIALTTVILETGMIEVKTELPVLKIDTPAGQVIASARRVKGKIQEVSFLNVPSFVFAFNQKADIPGLGEIHYDVAFGGAFYAICRADQLGIELVPANFRPLIEMGRSIKRAIMETLAIRHPFDEDLSFLYGTILIGPPQDPTHHSRNVCIFAEGEVDRSPTGTGVSARAAIHYTKGELKPGETFIIESIIGTCFKGRVLRVTRFGPYEAIIPEVTGSAHITGRHEFLLAPDDPLRYGFLLR